MIRPHWRVLTVLAFVLNVVVLVIPGRLDGNADVDVLQMPNLVAPASWAFTIWAVIYMGELAGMVWIFLVQSNDCQDAIARKVPCWGDAIARLRSKECQDALARSVPSWCAANIAQCLWCIAFRPWFIDHLWVSACMLGSIAACLFACQRAMLEGFTAKGIPATITRMAVVWPRSLHLGWTTAASIVNINSFIGQASFGEEVALCSLVLSITLAAVIGLGYTWSGLPTATVAIAWALQAVADGTPVGPDADSLGGPVLRGMSYSESAIAILLLTVAFSSAVATNVISCLRQRDQPEKIQGFAKSSSEVPGPDVTDSAIGG